MKKKYWAWIIPLFDTHRQEDKRFQGWTSAYSINQASMNLMHSYSYPGYFVEQPVESVVENPTGASKNSSISESHRKMRGELVRMETDMENAAPELAAAYRETCEASIARANVCDISDALEKFIDGMGMRHALERKLDAVTRFYNIEQFLKEAIIEELVNNCKCQFIKEEVK